MTSERDSRSLIPYMPQNDEIQLSTDSDAMYICTVAESIISIRPTDSCTRALTYLLTYLYRITSVFGDWPVFQFPDFSVNDWSSIPLPLVGPKIINV